MSYKIWNTLFFIFFVFLTQINLPLYSYNIEKSIINNIRINEYDGNNLSVEVNSSNQELIKNYEIKQQNEKTIIILPQSEPGKNIKIEQCSCNNLVKSYEIQYFPYINKNTKEFGYTKIKLYTNPQIEVEVKLIDNTITLAKEGQITNSNVKSIVTISKKMPKKFKSKNIMPIIENIEDKNKSSKLLFENRRNAYDLNEEERKLIRYKNSPIKFPLYKEIKFFIVKNIFVLFIGCILLLLIVVVCYFRGKKKDWKVKK